MRIRGDDLVVNVQVPMSAEEAGRFVRMFHNRALRLAGQDAVILDRIILLHQPSEPDEYDGSVDCKGCFNEWPCPTQAVLAEWGQA